MSVWKTPPHWVHCNGLNPYCPDKIEYAFHPAGWHDPENCPNTRKDIKLSKKDKRIKELQRDIDFLNEELDSLNTEYIALVQDYHRAVNRKAPEISTTSLYPNPKFIAKLKQLKNRQPRYAGDICLDLWPLRDWFRFSVKSWNPGKYAQVVIGPVRIEFYSA